MAHDERNSTPPSSRSGRFNPGTAFKNGKLLIFEDYSLTVMKPWPKPLAWRRTTRRPFRPHRPKIDLVHEPLKDGERAPWQTRRYNAIADFMMPAPAPMKEKIGRFPERQWHMMALLARCPGADDLVESTPALAFALASNWVFASNPPTQPMRAARSLVRKRQVEICEWLGFSPRPSTVNMLRKLQISDIGIRELLDLRDVLWDEDSSRLLQHARSISWHAIAIAAHPFRRKHFSAKFLAELGSLEPGTGETKSKLDNLQYALQGWIMRRAGNKVFHSFAQLQNFTDELHRNEPLPECPADTVFPEPPLAGTDAIVPIRTGRELLDEARAMQHCAANYHDEIMDGGRAFYCVLAPERATLCLECHEGVWHLDQLSGPQNAPVSQETHCAVYGWLSGLSESVLLKPSNPI